MKNSTLNFNKERIAYLTDAQMSKVTGGNATSTVHSFTCSWCMGIKVSAEYKGAKVSVSTK